MEEQTFTIKFTDFGIGKELKVKNEGFSPFELIGLLTHLLEKEKQKLIEDSENTTIEDLEKEMD
jgi:hypothetical protein